MNKKRGRPSQLLYVPPACRNSKKTDSNDECLSISNCNSETQDDSPLCKESKEVILRNSLSDEIENLCDNLDKSSVSQQFKMHQKDGKKNDHKSASDDMKNMVNLNDTCSCSKNYDEIDREKEQIERAIVKINRKSRSLIEYCESDNVLVIGKKENTECSNLSQGVFKNEQNEDIYSWEDILQNNEEESNKDKDAKCNSENNFKRYSDLLDKKMEDLDHVIEVYDFPISFKTQDIVHIYNDVQENPLNVKWCDDTHALLIFSTPAQARMALKDDKGIIKSRPMVDASPLSKRVASRIDLKPAMRRPATNMQTARRLINNYLGTKVAISKEEMEKEKKALIDAKEKKRLQRQSEKDAWEGHPRTNI